MEGSSIGPYRIVRKLGEGGMGAVWLGEHALLGRRAAIKVLLREFSANEQIVQRFFNEAKAVTAIADPGIVQVFDFGYHTDGSAFLVMELLEGEAMDTRLKRIGRFAPVDAVRLMAQIATSLGAAHAKGVVHRDLKPENIFIVGDPAVTGGERTKILDFGIAKLAGDEPGKLKTRTGAVMGTPVYMSPEQCRGMASIDARSDIYALGCVLFTMLCGRPPFESEGTGDLIIMHVRDQPPRPSLFVPGLTQALDALIMRCLEKNPYHRYQSTNELVQALAAVEPELYGIDPGASYGGPGYRRATTPAAALAFRQQPTQPTNPTQQTPMPTHSTSPSGSPTTLDSATSPVHPTQARSKSRGWMIILVAFVIAGGGTAAIIAGAGGGDGDGNTTTNAASPGSDQNAAPPVTPPADAAVATTTPVDAAPAVVPVDATEAVAATPDAAVAVEIDAGVTASTEPTTTTTKTKTKTKRVGTGTKRGSNGTASGSGTVDRGD
jgi:serine/threonine-protein kinase